MTDQRFEQLLHEVLDAETPARAPERLVPETQRAVRRVRRQPTWLATLLVRPMRVSRRVVVGSPIQRRLAMGVALLLLAVVTVGTVVVGSQVLGPRTIVVDASGNGDATTVTAGIALAEDGDIVLLRPVEYVEQTDDLLQSFGRAGQLLIGSMSEVRLVMAGHDPELER